MSTIRTVPLSGVRESEKNIYVAEMENEVFILDCGLQYPGNELLKVDVVIPDLTYLGEDNEWVVGAFLIRDHADAIGALSYLLSKIQVPVLRTKLAIELAELSVNNHAGTKKLKGFHVIDSRAKIDFGRATVSFFKTTYTTPDSVGVSIKTKEGDIVYVGDFKFDQSAVEMHQTDYNRLAEIGKEDVLTLFSGSSDAENPAQVVSEVRITDEVFGTVRCWEGRIIVACVVSNL